MWEKKCGHSLGLQIFQLFVNIWVKHDKINWVRKNWICYHNNIYDNVMIIITTDPFLSVLSGTFFSVIKLPEPSGVYVICVTMQMWSEGDHSRSRRRRWWGSSQSAPVTLNRLHQESDESCSEPAAEVSGWKRMNEFECRHGRKRHDTSTLPPPPPSSPLLPSDERQHGCVDFLFWWFPPSAPTLWLPSSH